MAQYAGLPEGAEIISTPQYAGLPKDAEVIPPAPLTPAKANIFDKALGTVQTMAAGFNSGAGQLRKKVFGSEGTAFPAQADYWKHKAAANGITQDTVYGKVASGVGAFPAALPEWLPNPTGVAVGTTLNASGGYQDAVAKGESGTWGAIKGGTKHLLFRGAFKVIGAIPVAKALPEALPQAVKTGVDVTSKATAMGGIMAGETAIEGGDSKDVTANFIIGAGLPIMSHVASTKPFQGKLKESLVEQGVPEDVATHLEQKSQEIDTSDPRNVEIFTEQVDSIIEKQRMVDAVTKEAQPIEEPITPPQEEPTTTLNEPPKPFYKDQYVITKEERAAYEEHAKTLIDENGDFIEGTKPPESLLNLDKVSTGSDAENLATLYARGEMLREKVAERLGKDSGKKEQILMQLDDALLKQIGKETGIDLLAESAQTTAQMEDIRVAAIKTRYMLDKYTVEAAKASERAKAPEATPEEIAYATYMKNMAEQFYAKSVEQGRLASWILNDRNIIPDAEAVLGIRELSFEDFKNSPGLIDSVMKGIDEAGGLTAAQKDINEYLKAGDLQSRLEKIKLKDKSSIMQTVFEFSSINMLSAVYGRAKDLFHNVTRWGFDDLETFGATLVPDFMLRGDSNPNPLYPNRGKGTGITLREASYQLYGDIQGGLEAVTKGWKYSKEIPIPELKKAMESPIEMLYQSLENVESFIDDAGFMHGKTKATLEGIGRKRVSREYIESTTTGKYFSAFLDGLGRMTHAGESIKDITYKLIDLHGLVGRSLVFGAMKVTDMPSEYMGYNAKAYALAARETVKQGIKGEQSARDIEMMVTMAKMLRDDIKIPDSPEYAKYKKQAKDIHEESMKYALERTLKQEFESDYAKTAESLVNHSALGTGLKVMAGQYFSTPARLFKYVSDRNVIGMWASKNMRESIMGNRGKEAQSLAIAKVTFGTLAQTAAYHLIQNGVITLLAPKDERKTWRDAGMLEAAINIRGRLYKLSALEPFGTFITQVVSLYTADQAAKDNPDKNRVWEFFKANLNDVTQRSYMKSLFDLQNVFNGEERALEKFMLGQGSKLVPYGGLITSLSDMSGYSEVRAVDGAKDLIAKVYNPTSLAIEPDLYGKPRETNDRFFGVPTKIMAPDGSARSEIVRLGIKLPEAPKTVDPISTGGVKGSMKLDKLDQRDYLMSLNSPEIRMEERLQEAISSPEYKQASAKVQKVKLEALIKASHQMALARIQQTKEFADTAKAKGKAIGEVYNDKSPKSGQENLYKFTTDVKNKENKILRDNGLSVQ